MSTTPALPRSQAAGNRRRSTYHRTIAGVAVAIAIGAGCQAATTEELTGAPVEAPAPGLVEAAAGSDRHLELRAAEIAARQARAEAAAGSDRHLELRAAEIAARQAAEQVDWAERVLNRR